MYVIAYPSPIDKTMLLEERKIFESLEEATNVFKSKIYFYPFLKKSLKIYELKEVSK